MPLFLEQETVHKGILGIWKIREDESYFHERLQLTEDELQILAAIKGSGRRIEWLAVRYLLHHLTGRSERASLHKDKYGKPFLPDPNYHISISHSHEMGEASTLAHRPKTFTRTSKKSIQRPTTRAGLESAGYGGTALGSQEAGEPPVRRAVQ